MLGLDPPYEPARPVPYSAASEPPREAVITPLPALTLPDLDTETAVERYAAVIRRIARDKRIPTGRARKRFVEMLKFLDVCALAEQTVSPPPRVDDAWHAFLVFTRDYAAYCEDRFGFFIHHNPTESSDTLAYRRAYTQTGERFGALDRRVWPRPRAGGGGGGSPSSGGWFGDFLGCGGGGCGGGGCGGGC